MAELLYALYNPWLYAGEEFIARPDAWWPDAGVVVEVDSREFEKDRRCRSGLCKVAERRCGGSG